GKQRPLGIPCIKDRVVQTAVMLVLEPIFEADLEPEQHAYRPERSALDAVRLVERLVRSGHTEVVDADLSGYFDSIPHAELMKSVSRRISDGRVLRLIKMWLEAPVEETDAKGNRHRTTRNKDQGIGSAQGAPISPLFANVYMRRFVKGWKTGGHEQRLEARIINSADDFVICCRGTAEEAMNVMRTIPGGELPGAGPDCSADAGSGSGSDRRGHVAVGGRPDDRAGIATDRNGPALLDGQDTGWSVSPAAALSPGPGADHEAAGAAADDESAGQSQAPAPGTHEDQPHGPRSPTGLR
ncbi:MAG: reverse transcriptase domain-containing protein, partial [Isosphaeraceae bacterium]